MEDYLISVIIPTYKRPLAMLKRALNSVLSQTYQSIEIIIVDDSPSDFEERDNIKRYIDELDNEKIIYIQHPKNMGGCAARNTGILKSNGEYIAFLDDDDEWLADKLDKQLNFLIQKRADMVYCSWIMCINKKGKKMKKIRKLPPPGDKTIYESLLFKNYIGSTSFVLVKRKCFDKCGMFNTKLKSCQDWDMWLRISKSFNVVYLDYPLVKYYIHDLGRITTNHSNQISGHEEILDIYMDELKKYPMALQSQLYKLSLSYSDQKLYKKSLNTWWNATMINKKNIPTITVSLLKILKRRFLINIL